MKTLGKISPSREAFLAMAPTRRVIPVTISVLADSLTPIGLYRSLAGGRPGTFLMESAAPGGVWSRYSFVGVNSPATLSTRGGEAYWQGHVPEGLPTGGVSVEVLRDTVRALHTEPIP
ncbi:MAG TPA: anthranilate synthase component I, partial [Micrococcaceae bacterium]|nr:anthranilate synthase component I [Micrococcaceae bacterium]